MEFFRYEKIEEDVYDIFYVLIGENQLVMRAATEEQAIVLIDTFTQVFVFGMMASSQALSNHVQKVNNAIYSVKYEDVPVEEDIVEEPQPEPVVEDTE